MKIRILLSAVLLASLPAFAAAAAAAECESKPKSEACPSGGPWVEIADIIARVSKKTGKQFLVDPRVRGMVPTATLDLDRVDYPRLLAILRINQFAAYEAEGLVNVTLDANARSLPIPLSDSIGASTPDDELVTMMIQGKNVCAAWTVPVLRPLMPQIAHLAALPQSNSLLIVDHASNVRRIIALFERLDSQAPASKQPCAGPSPYASKSGS